MPFYPNSARLLLEGRKKHRSAHLPSTRVRSIHETLNKILPLATKIGVTRISDITFMDRLFMYNFSVVLLGTEDLIRVYGGKGMTKKAAIASALMEAIERYSSLASNCNGPLVRGSYLQLSKAHKVLHPDEVVEPVRQGYDDKNAIIDFMLGFDLLSNEVSRNRVI